MTAAAKQTCTLQFLYQCINVRKYQTSLISVHLDSGKSTSLFLCLFFSSLVIRGEKDEHAVLCSKDKTYDMKIADTSNMLLFVPGCKTPEELNADPASCNIIHPQVCLSGVLFVCFNSLLSYSL